jgi:hypothetical protein
MVFEYDIKKLNSFQFKYSLTLLKLQNFVQDACENNLQHIFAFVMLVVRTKQKPELLKLWRRLENIKFLASCMITLKQPTKDYSVS